MMAHACCVCGRVKLTDTWMRVSLPQSISLTHGYCDVCIEIAYVDRDICKIICSINEYAAEKKRVSIRLIRMLDLLKLEKKRVQDLQKDFSYEEATESVTSLRSYADVVLARVWRSLDKMGSLEGSQSELIAQ